MWRVWPATKVCGEDVVAVAIAAFEVEQVLAACASELSTTAPLTGVAVTLAPGVVGAGLGIPGVGGMLKQKLKLLPEIFVSLGDPDAAWRVGVQSSAAPVPAIVRLDDEPQCVALCALALTAT